MPTGDTDQNPSQDPSNTDIPGTVSTENLEKEINHRILDPLKVRFRLQDVFQIVVGSAVLAIPVACTEEAWNLSKTLPTQNIVAILFSSLFFVALFVYHVFYKDFFREDVGQFLSRVFIGYLVTLLTVGGILILFQKFPISADPQLALRRLILVGFPACFSATVVDSMR